MELLIDIDTLQYGSYSKRLNFVFVKYWFVHSTAYRFSPAKDLAIIRWVT